MCWRALLFRKWLLIVISHSEFVLRISLVMFEYIFLDIMTSDDRIVLQDQHFRDLSLCSRFATLSSHANASVLLSQYLRNLSLTSASSTNNIHWHEFAKIIRISTTFRSYIHRVALHLSIRRVRNLYYDALFVLLVPYSITNSCGISSRFN